jgi:hypothetical protein
MGDIMTIKLQNIATGENSDGSFYSFDIEIDGVTITNCMEWDSVINGDDIDTWFDVNGKDKVRAAMSKHKSEDEIDAIIDNLFATIEGTLRDAIND